jgi:hypothetical protein
MVPAPITATFRISATFDSFYGFMNQSKLFF